MDPRVRNLDPGTALRCLGDLVMPRVCAVCGTELLPQEEDMCTVCLADLPLTRYAARSHNPMADLFNARIQERDRFPEMYAYACALFFYSPESPYSALTRELKYDGAVAMGRRISAMLASELAASPLYGDVDLVVPVPLHRSRLRKRGYNQAEVIAREIAKVLGARLDTSVLRRVRNTRSQTGVSVVEKAGNVSGAFLATLPDPASASMPRHVLLVDDLFTTGSTLSECHSALRRVFPSGVRISAATLGFVSGAR